MTNVSSEVRKPVARFAEFMEKILRENDHKDGWEGCCPGWLMERLGQELREARAAYRKWVDFRDFRNGAEETRLVDALQREVTDVANFCMMVYDVLEAQRQSIRTPISSGSEGPKK